MELLSIFWLRDKKKMLRSAGKERQEGVWTSDQPSRKILLTLFRISRRPSDLPEKEIPNFPEPSDLARKNARGFFRGNSDLISGPSPVLNKSPEILRHHILSRKRQTSIFDH